MSNNDDGTLSFGTAVDMSGLEEGMNAIQQKIYDVCANTETQSAHISQVLSKIPTVNIDFVTNASQSLHTIDAAFAEIDRVVDENKSAIVELESEYDRLSKKSASNPEEIEALNQQKQAIEENIALRRQIIDEAGKTADALAQTEQSLKAETAAVIESATTIRDQLSSIGAQCEQHEATIARLESESQNLKNKMAAAFSSGDDAEYNKLRQKTAAIEQEISTRKKSLAELQKQSNELEDEAQKIEKATQATKRNAAETDNNTQKQVSLRQRLREMKIELVEMEAAGQRGTQAYRDLQEEAARLTDAWGDAQAQANILANDQRGMQGIISGLTGLSGVFSAAQGAVGLFTGENEELQKVMLKVQSLMAITMGLQQVQQTLNKDSAFMLVTVNKLKEYWNKITGQSVAIQEAETAATEGNTIAQVENTTATTADTSAQTANNTSTVAGTTAQTANTASTKLSTVATWANVAATKASSLALKGLKLALAATGIGLLVVAVGELASWLMSLSDKANEASKAFEEQEKLQEDGRKAYAKASVEISDYTTKIENFNGTKQQEKKLVEELNSKYGSAMGYYDSLSKWKDVLKQKGEAYCNMLLKEAEAQAYLNKYTEAFIALQEVKDKAAAGEYDDRWYEFWNWGGKGDAEKRADAIKEAGTAVKKWYGLYKQTMQDAQAIRDNFDLNPHIDPKASTSNGGKSAGNTFDPKAAAREYKKIYDEYVADVTKFIKDANAKITEQQIESSGDGLVRELNDIRYSTYQKQQAWQEQLKQLAEIRKNAVKEQYMTQKGHTEDTWEKTAASKKTVADYQNELLFNTDGTQTELAKKYYEVLNGITQHGEAQIAETRQKYYDGWVSQYGTTEQKLDVLTAKYTKILNEVPEQFRKGVEDAWDAEESQIKLTDLKKEMNWEEVFGDLDRVATSSLQSIKKKLQDYLSKNKELAPEGIKEIVSSIEKIDDKLSERNPFTTLGKSLDNLVTANKAVKKAQDEYNKAVEEGTSAEISNAKAALDAAKNVKQKALADATKSLHSTVSQIKEVKGCFDDLTGTLEAFGVKIPEKLNGFLGGIGDAIGGLESMDLTKPFSVISGGLKTIGGIGKAIGSLFNNDGKKEKRIQALQKQIDKLQVSYEKLEKSVDKVYSKDASKMIEQQNKMLQQQKVLINNQIREEESKKDTDKSKIEAWRKQIDEINETISDNREKAKDAIFGEDVKSAIENFASTYADAWSSVEDRTESAKDAVRSMMKKMVSESIKAAIQSSGAMERIRNQLESFFADNVLSDWEQNYVLKMAEDMQKQLDKQFGWADSLFSGDDTSEREGESKGIATASQESVDENNARLTTIQGHTYTLVQGMSELTATSAAILVHVSGIHDDTTSIDRKLNGLEDMSKGIKNIQNAVDDISNRGVRLKT